MSIFATTVFGLLALSIVLTPALSSATTQASTPASARPATAGGSIAFYYADDPPISVLTQFDRLVLEPDNINAGQLTELISAGAKPYAYLSIGELGPYRRDAEALRTIPALGDNAAWGSRVMDLREPAWTNYLMQRVDTLQAAGYRGLFMDTMDSFMAHTDTPQARAAQQAALAAVVQRIHQRYPTLKLISNRGFEVLDAIAPMLEAIAAESLYAGWDNSSQTFAPVPAESREWLLGQLQKAQQQHALEVIVIDYLPPAQRDEAREVAARITALGMVPWVTTPALDHVGLEPQGTYPSTGIPVDDSATRRQP